MKLVGEELGVGSVSGGCACESLSRFERIQETVDARDADSKEGTGRNANAAVRGIWTRVIV
jgi:hypothetical protein